MFGRWRDNECGAESGAVLVFTLVALTVMLGMSALVIDLGYGYVMDRRASNAADHASLAAAFASCLGDDVNVAAQTAAVNNGFEVADLTLTSPDTNTYRAVVATQVNTFFAGVIGFDTVAVSASAVAKCEAGVGGGYAVFAGGNSCGGYGKDEIDISGSNQEIYGGIHSNGQIKIGGSSNDFGPGHVPEDTFTYVTTLDNGGSGNGFDTGYPTTAPYEPIWPVDFDRIHYRTLAQTGGPDYHYVNGDIDGSYIESNGDGLYYATGKLTLDTTVNLNVTVIAEDLLDVSGSSQTLNPFIDDLLMFGAAPYAGVDRCDSPGIKMAGSDNDWNGIIYAPWSQAEFSGSSNTAVHGSIVAWSVKLNGSGVNVTNDGGGTSALPDVALVE